jgi:hypothetical protein
VAEDVVLVILDNEGAFKIEPDSLNHAAGSVLSQLKDGVWLLVAFMSKTYNEAQRNYEIYNKEMLAIMLSLEEWRQYLLGLKKPFEIWTDHQNLTYSYGQVNESPKMK